LKSVYGKILKKFIFYLLQFNIFLVFLDHFDMQISKIILKNKKNIILMYLNKKHFKKQPQQHFHIGSSSP